MFCKSGFLKPRINLGKILIVGNNSETKATTIKVLTVFIVIVMAKCIAVVLQPGIQYNHARNYSKCNDLIKYKDGSMTSAIFCMTVCSCLLLPKVPS